MRTNTLLTVSFLLSFSSCAHAYIDPGSGSFMLQMLIASLLGASFTIKMYFKNIKEKLRSIFSSQKDKNNKEEQMLDHSSKPD